MSPGPLREFRTASDEHTGPGNEATQAQHWGKQRGWALVQNSIECTKAFTTVWLCFPGTIFTMAHIVGAFLCICLARVIYKLQG